MRSWLGSTSGRDPRRRFRPQLPSQPTAQPLPFLLSSSPYTLWYPLVSTVLFVERFASASMAMSVRPPPQKKPKTEPSSTTVIPPPNPQPAFAPTPGRPPIQQRPPPGQQQQQQGNGQQQVRPPFQLGRPPAPGGVRPQMMGTPQQQNGIANGGGARVGQQQGICKFP